MPRSSVDARDVDERRRPREAEVHHRHEALAAGEHLGVLAQLAEPLERVLERVDAVVVEVRGLHCERPIRKPAPKPTAPPASAQRTAAGDAR